MLCKLVVLLVKENHFKISQADFLDLKILNLKKFAIYKGLKHMTAYTYNKVMIFMFFLFNYHAKRVTFLKVQWYQVVLHIIKFVFYLHNVYWNEHKIMLVLFFKFEWLFQSKCFTVNVPVSLKKYRTTHYIYVLVLKIIIVFGLVISCRRLDV